MKVVDGFLEKNEFTKLQNYFLGGHCQWRYAPFIDNPKDIDKFQFIHVFFTRCNPVSEDYSILDPVFRKIQMKSLYRIKANLLTRTPEIVENSFHYDVSDFTPEQAKNWLTSILYINTNNGYTRFETGEVIESVENRLVTFPANLKHTGTSCTDEKVRVVVNFNYFS
tara:strand:- start:8988 stop:9488 length:501 start_codon:yes stop_codon:yes gene_type:complete